MEWYEEGGDYNEISMHRRKNNVNLIAADRVTRATRLEERMRFLSAEDHSSYIAHLQ